VGTGRTIGVERDGVEKLTPGGGEKEHRKRRG